MNDTSINSFARQITVDRLLDELRMDIITNRFRGGDRIAENELSERYGVSRGSVRSALQVLNSEGLIRILPNGRKEVIGFTAKQARDLYDLRWIIENRALEIIFADRSLMNFTPMIEILNQIRAAYHEKDEEADRYRLDLEFHRAIILASGNQALVKASESYSSTMLVLMRLYVVQGHEEFIRTMYEQHRVLFEYIVGRDERVFSLLRDHIMSACP